MKSLRGLPVNFFSVAEAEQASDFAVRGATAFFGFLPSVGTVAVGVVVGAGVTTFGAVVATGAVADGVVGAVIGTAGFTIGVVGAGVVVVCANDTVAPIAIRVAAANAVLKMFIGISVLGYDFSKAVLDHHG